MPTITMSVSRGNPLPWPFAVLFSVVGAGLIVAGFTVVPEVDGMGSNIVLEIVAIALAGPALVIYLLAMVRRIGKRVDVTAGIPEELPEPPGNDAPAVVGVLAGEGTPPRRAVAGVLFGLAVRRALTINEFGEKVVIDLAKDAAPTSETEAVVLTALRERADERGQVTAPPLWEGRVGWWREFVRGARKQSDGLLESRIPLVGTMVLLILVGTATSLIFFWRVPVFVGCILFVNGFPHLLARASGFRLADEGKRHRAAWIAFARYLHAQGSLRDVGPGGVAVWGPNLVYGAVLGEADKAARPLTPDADEDEPIDEVTGYTKVVQL